MNPEEKNRQDIGTIQCNYEPHSIPDPFGEGPKSKTIKNLRHISLQQIVVYR